MAFVQGIDYGPRAGTLGISFHISEGGDGLVGFLARHAGESEQRWHDRTNGVSVHVAILSDGTTTQMLGWDRCSGNLNPAHRAAEYGYYGGSHLRAVLGSHWPDPNMWTVTAEIAGYRADGPTDKQVKAALEWGEQMKDRYPTIRGATGHHDQSTKPCPGTSANMKAIFAGLGGHGLWAQGEQPMRSFIFGTGAQSGTLVVKGEGHYYLRLLDNTRHGPLDPGKFGIHSAFGPVKLVGGGINGPADPRVDGYIVGTEAAFLLASDVEFAPAAGIADAVAAEHERTRKAAIAAVEAI